MQINLISLFFFVITITKCYCATGNHIKGTFNRLSVLGISLHDYRAVLMAKLSIEANLAEHYDINTFQKVETEPIEELSKEQYFNIVFDPNFRKEHYEEVIKDQTVHWFDIKNFKITKDQKFDIIKVSRLLNKASKIYKVAMKTNDYSHILPAAQSIYGPQYTKNLLPKAIKEKI